MINFFKFLVPGLAASLIGLISLPAQAIFVIQPPPSSTFYFKGNCEDCASSSNPLEHRITAKLVLQSYVQGDQINAANFVSFSYDGSDMLDPYSILSSPSSSSLLLSSVIGHISFASTANVFNLIGFNNNYEYHFVLSDAGRWDTGRQQRSFDTGGSGAFGPNAVPEPATMLLMGAALAAAGLARRRRQR